MIDENTINHQKRLRDEIEDIKECISYIEHEINSSGHVEQLSDAQFIDMWKRLKTISNFSYNAKYFWDKYTKKKGN